MQGGWEGSTNSGCIPLHCSMPTNSSVVNVLGKLHMGYSQQALSACYRQRVAVQLSKLITKYYVTNQRPEFWHRTLIGQFKLITIAHQQELLPSHVNHSTTNKRGGMGLAGQTICGHIRTSKAVTNVQYSLDPLHRTSFCKLRAQLWVIWCRGTISLLFQTWTLLCLC